MPVLDTELALAIDIKLYKVLQEVELWFDLQKVANFLHILP